MFVYIYIIYISPPESTFKSSTHHRQHTLTYGYQVKPSTSPAAAEADVLLPSHLWEVALAAYFPGAPPQVVN